VLRAHLFDRLIAATVMTRPPSDNSADFFRPRSRYDPIDIERWLRFLAGNMDRWGTKEFDWARDVPALTTPAHPERIANRLTLIVTAVRAYVDVVLAQRRPSVFRWPCFHLCLPVLRALLSGN
jgi:hypothetical protein